MRNIILIILFVFSLTSAQAQDWKWAKSAGGTKNDKPQSLATDGMGNFYMTGLYLSPTISFDNFTLTNVTGGDRYVVKYDAEGNVVWVNNISGSTGYRDNSSIVVDKNDNVFVVSEFYSPTITFGPITLSLSSSNGMSDAYIVKYDNDGRVLWAKNTKGPASAKSLGAGVDRDGNLYVTGTFGASTVDFGGVNLSSSDRTNMFLVKYDHNGTALWAKKASTSSLFSSVLNTTVDPDGNSYVIGKLTNGRFVFGAITLDHIGGNSAVNPFLVKYDSNGNALWVRSGVSQDMFTTPKDVAVDSKGNVVVTGSYYSSDIDFSGFKITNSRNPRADVFLVKYDKNGNVSWLRGAGGNDDDHGRTLSIDSNDHIYVGGFFGSSKINFDDKINLSRDGLWDSFLVRYTPSGTPIWVSSASGSGNKEMEKIVCTSQGDLYAAGTFDRDIRFENYPTLNSFGENDIFIAKLKDSNLGSEEFTVESSYIYPNPAKETITIKLKMDSAAGAYFITDINGRRLIQGNIDGSDTQINVSNLAKGIYMLNLTGEKTKSHKFIKN